MEFVINEWFLDWHRPSAGPIDQQRARDFVGWLLESEHRIVLLRQSPFTQKLNAYRREFHYHPMCQLYLKIFFSQVVENPDKCRILETAPMLPEETEARLAVGNFGSDRYLFQSAADTAQRLIVTTDQKLIDHMNQKDGFNLILPEELFQIYIVS